MKRPNGEEGDLSVREIVALLQREYARHGKFTLGEKPSYPPLNEALDTRSCRLRLAAVIELGLRKDRTAVPILKSALWDWYVPVRASAVKALEAAGDPSGKETFIALARSSDFKVRFDALRVLALLRDETLSSVFEDAVTCNDPRISTLASEALFSLGEKSGLEALIRKLKEGSEAERMEAAGFLAVIDDEEAQTAVRDFLKAEDVAPHLKDAVSSNLKRARRRKH